MEAVRTRAGAALLPGYGEYLKPYVPRLLVDWTAETPEAPYKAIDGSLAFVDISGFTALTERLARRGKIGAEILRDSLDAVFRSLLDEAYAWGAGLLKWGGDALLLLFDGAEHPARAARAAWEMQRTLDRVGRLRLGGRTQTLRMSIGIASGPIDFFAVGSVHRELIVLGPTATATAATEAVADAGEICITPEVAHRLPEPIVTAKGDALLLLSPPDAARGRSPEVGAVGDDIVLCIPAAARAHVLLNDPEPEHRTITAAFIDLMRTDDLLAELGPAAFSAALDERIVSIQEAALRHEVPFNVTDISKGSVKVLLTAGAPSSTGHDEEQALRVLREVFDRDGLIPMRAGANTGSVFTGDFGPPYRRAYMVFGDAVNTAARVMVRAEPGQILATDTVLERSRTIFETTPIEPFHAKGKAEPVRASTVGAILGRRVRRDDSAPFVGRAGEAEAVARALASGTGCLVELSGPSGIGKSRLAREAIAAVPGVHVHATECSEYDASTPYSVARALVRSLLGLEPDARTDRSERRLRGAVAAVAPELEPWLPLLGIVIGLDLPATAETRALDDRFVADTIADVTAALVAAMRGRDPAVFLVEDAQFADEASRKLLNRLAGQERVVVTHSAPEAPWIDGEAEKPPHLLLTLLPLGAGQALELLERATDDEPLHPHEAEAIALRSAGSPLFLLELLGAARAGGARALPDSIEAVATAEIDRLAPQDRSVLRHAAALGTTFERALLEHTVGTLDDATLDRLQGILDRADAGRLRFRTSLLRDAAYEGLPFRRRRELHARAAEAIEDEAESLEDEAATLALHYSAAGRHAKTWQYGRLAGDHARAVAANVEAARLYELALGAASHARDVTRRERAAVLVDLGTVRETAGLFDASYEALRRATALLADDPLEQARIFARRTRARVRTGAYARALAETSRGLRLVAVADDTAAVAARATLLAMRSEIKMLQGRAREAIGIAERAVVDARRADELEALAHAYTALDGSYQLLGHPEQAVHERIALDIYRRLGHTRLSGVYGLNVGVQAYADGRWDEAAELYRQAQADCLRAGDRQNAALAATNLGELLISRGQLEEASQLLTDARRVLRSAGYAAFALFAEVQLARCALEGGDATGAATTLRRIAAEAEGVGYAALVLEAGVYLAHAEARVGSPAAGLELLERAVGAAGDEAALYEAAVGRARAACLAALGRTDEARRQLEAALAAARAQSLPYEQLLALRALREEPRELGRLARLLGVPE